MSSSLTIALAVTALIAALIVLAAWLAAGRMLARRSPDPRRTPADVGLSFEEVTFPSRDGLKLAGRLTGQGDRPAVIFCAGTFGSMDGDTDLLPMFAGAGFDVLQFDWRAHGESEGARGSLGLREVLDVQGALDFLELRGMKRVGLMGFSFGGAVALRAAALDRRVRCVACDGGFVRLERAAQGIIAERIGAGRAAVLRPLTSLMVWMAGLRLRESLRHAEPLAAARRVAPRPILFIHGASDPIVPVADQDAIFAACGEPKSLWRVEGAGHREAHRRAPDDYRQHVIGFFRDALS